MLLVSTLIHKMRQYNWHCFVIYKAIMLCKGYGTKANRKIKWKLQQDVFVKQECHRNGHFLRNVTFIFDLDLGTSRCILMRYAFIPNMSLVSKLGVMGKC